MTEYLSGFRHGLVFAHGRRGEPLRLRSRAWLKGNTAGSMAAIFIGAPVAIGLMLWAWGALTHW